MKEPYGKGLATHPGPESCAGHGNMAGEALAEPKNHRVKRALGVSDYRQLRRLAHGWYSSAARLTLITWSSGSDSVGLGRISDSPAEAVNLTVRSLPPAAKARLKPQ